ncbi:P-loop containing nucleoside triphosphate hydrolase protein [Auriculariales sp. MPI-PUGE-AT-0066]|nr:P-loop containing nucleoside triphosphate hydrolase protein [Auriculariales sp. MPI-PUGE-AT-0066]
MINAAARVGGMRVTSSHRRGLTAQVQRARPPVGQQYPARSQTSYNLLPLAQALSAAVQQVQALPSTLEELVLADPVIFAATRLASTSAVTLDSLEPFRRTYRRPDPDGLTFVTTPTIEDGGSLMGQPTQPDDAHIASSLLAQYLPNMSTGKSRERGEQWLQHVYDTPEFQRLSRRYRPEFGVFDEESRYFHEVGRYKGHFDKLLRYEQTEGERTVTDRLSQWPLDRLIAHGVCLPGMIPFWLASRHFGRPVAGFVLAGEPGRILPPHQITVGTQVLVSDSDPLTKEPLRGQVVAVPDCGTRIDVCFKEHVDMTDRIWRLDMGTCDITFERMRTAMNLLTEDPADQVRRSTFDHQYILHGTHLRDILLRHSPEPKEPNNESIESIEPPTELTHDLPNAQAMDDGQAEALEQLGETRSQQQRFDSPLMHDQRLQSWARRYSQLDPIVLLGDPELDLNSTQVRAIALMLATRVSLVQGPPGTGKTKTIVEAVRLLKQHFHVQHPLMICTYTNVAVDNLVEGLARAGLRPLRFGSTKHSTLRPEYQKYTVRAKRNAHIIGPHLDKYIASSEKLSKELNRIMARIREGPMAGVERARLLHIHKIKKNERKQILNTIYKLERLFMQEVIDESDVVCTTCISAGSATLSVADFPIVFMDEASMSTEPASLIPLMRGCEHLSLIGDHKQLPPVIISDEAEKGGMRRSLFERLTEEGDVPSIMLDVQYRMHPDLSRFPASEFYDKTLLDGTVSAVTGEVAAALRPPRSRFLARRTLDDVEAGVDVALDGAEEEEMHNMVFLDHRHPEATRDRSLVNIGEALLVCDVVEDLLLQNPDLLGRHIGVIAPYAAQIKQLESLLHMGSRERWVTALGTRRAMEVGDVEVKTVDGFEGREKDVIVFSTVRNNSAGYIGFLVDRRRLNVGLTRAKRGLVVVGSVRTLGRAQRKGAWARFVEYLNARSLVVRIPDDAARR